MKPGQSTFDERISRINKGRAMNAVDVVKPGHAKMIADKGKKKIFHLDMLAAGGMAGAIAGVLFAENIGLLFLMSLPYEAIYELVMADYVTGAYLGVIAFAPIAWLWTLIFSRTAQRAFQFWSCYAIGIIAANHIEVRYVIEFVAIPAFWDYVGAYTSAKDVVNDAVATQPQF